jgi:beta-lactamase class A
MQQNRRSFLARTAVTAAGATCGSRAYSAEAALDSRGNKGHVQGLERIVLDSFLNLPDRKALKIWAPPVDGAPEFLVQLNPDQQLFAASTMKALILCERLRQLDSPEVESRIKDHEISLDKAVWSPGSEIFNPPDLSGLVSERTAMEAMVIHSDNTATDMVLKQAGAGAVRDFISSIGLTRSMIPDSTRVFAGYLAGAPDYETITWDQLLALPQGPLAHPFLNEVQTLASSPNDLVSFFSRALQGQFFSCRETLSEFRRILLLGDIRHLVPFPLGLSVFGKAGYADISGAHARSIAGAVYFPNRWVYFSMMLNWDAEEDKDSQTVDAFYSAIRKSISLLQQHL